MKNVNSLVLTTTATLFAATAGPAVADAASIEDGTRFRLDRTAYLKQFETVFQKRSVPDEIPEHPLPAAAHGGSLSVRDLEYLLVEAEIVESRGEAKRLLTQQAVEIDGKKVVGDDVAVADGSVIKVGKRRFLRLVKSE